MQQIGISSLGAFVGVVGAVVLVLAIIAVVRWWRRRAQESELPPLVFPLRPGRGVPAEPGSFGLPPVEPVAENGSIAGPVGERAGDGGPQGEWAAELLHSSDSTLQLLPGRLERVAGSGASAEIRFVRAPEAAAAEFTLGRSDGPAHHHVRLDAPTVSRLHARMRFEHGRWHIANLSSTNPLALNGRALPAGDEAAELADGDEIRMGELIFRFRGAGL